MHGVQRCFLRQAFTDEKRPLEVRCVFVEGTVVFDGDTPKTSTTSITTQRRAIVGFSDRPGKSPPGRDCGAVARSVERGDLEVGTPVGGEGYHRAVQSGAPEAVKEAIRGTGRNARVAASEGGVGDVRELSTERRLEMGNGREQIKAALKRLSEYTNGHLKPHIRHTLSTK